MCVGWDRTQSLTHDRQEPHTEILNFQSDSPFSALNRPQLLAKGGNVGFIDSGSISFHRPPQALLLIGWLRGRGYGRRGACLNDRALSRRKSGCFSSLVTEAGSMSFIYAPAKQDRSRDPTH